MTILVRHTCYNFETSPAVDQSHTADRRDSSAGSETTLGEGPPVSLRPSLASKTSLRPGENSEVTLKTWNCGIALEPRSDHQTVTINWNTSRETVTELIAMINRTDKTPSPDTPIVQDLRNAIHIVPKGDTICVVGDQRVQFVVDSASVIKTSPFLRAMIE